MTHVAETQLFFPEWSRKYVSLIPTMNLNWALNSDSSAPRWSHTKQERFDFPLTIAFLSLFFFNQIFHSETQRILQWRPAGGGGRGGGGGGPPSYDNMFQMIWFKTSTASSSVNTFPAHFFFETIIHPQHNKLPEQ